MVLDPADPNTRSAGSFFLNPVVSAGEFRAVEERWAAGGGRETIPAFPAGDRMKVPAAWLVEQAGFGKGYRRGSAGVSTRHSLALVNYGESAADLLALAAEIQDGVETRFGIRLEPEPVIVR